MKRDLDLIREILLHIEGGQQYDGTREFYYSKPEEMDLAGCQMKSLSTTSPC
jgi:hypothetical protein